MIDFHIHISHPSHLRPWVKDWYHQNFEKDFAGPLQASGLDVDAYVDSVLTPAGIRALLQATGIDWAVALADPTPITTGMTTNDYMGEFCRQANALPDPAHGPAGRLLPCASINPYLENDLGEELERLVQAYGVRVIKVYPVYQHHYPNDARLYPLYARAEALGLPMLVHTGSSVFKGARIKYGDPLLLDDVAIDFPRLTILMAHCGRPFWYEQAFWMARRHDNVYMELSGLPAKNLLTTFPRLEMLAHKVIYGSDWPGNPDLGRNIATIQALPISDASKQAILHDNAARLLGLMT